MFEIREYNVLRKRYIKSGSQLDLQQVREYLDSNKYGMPQPKYVYDEEDKGTHKFLDGRYIYGRNNDKGLRYREVLNPNFRYAHLF